MGWSAVLVCLGLKGFSRCRTFHVKPEIVLGKWEWLVILPGQCPKTALLASSPLLEPFTFLALPSTSVSCWLLGTALDLRRSWVPRRKLPWGLCVGEKYLCYTLSQRPQCSLCHFFQKCGALGFMYLLFSHCYPEWVPRFHEEGISHPISAMVLHSHPSSQVHQLNPCSLWDDNQHSHSRQVASHHSPENHLKIPVGTCLGTCTAFFSRNIT